jgi:hypothetical protein
MDVILPEASAAGNRSSITAAVRRNARVLTPFAALVISVCMGNGQSAVRRNASVQEAQVTAALALGLWDSTLCRSVLAAAAIRKSQYATAELLLEIDESENPTLARLLNGTFPADARSVKTAPRR